MELYVRYENEVFSLLVHPFYARPDMIEEIGAEGFLYPPYFGSLVDFGMFGPKTVGHWLEKTQKKLDELDTDDLRDEIQNVYGIGPLITNHRETILEIKESPVKSAERKLYRVERFVCQPAEDRPLRNITDPHFLKGHIFIPISQNAVKDFESDSYRKYVKGREIVGNYQNVLSRSDEVKYAIKHAANTTRQDWVTIESGYLVLIDIAGFGQMTQHIKSKSGNIFETGSDIADRFRNGIAEVFESVLFVSDPVQSYFTGDGMIASLPLRGNGGEAVLKAFLDRYKQCLTYLDELNHAASELSKKTGDEHPTVGSRITIHHGSYEFGRIGGPRSTSGNFSGDSIVELARTESALSQAIKDQDGDGCHWIGFTDSAHSKLTAAKATELLGKKLKTYSTRIKERDVTVRARSIS